MVETVYGSLKRTIIQVGIVLKPPVNAIQALHRRYNVDLGFLDRREPDN